MAMPKYTPLTNPAPACVIAGQAVPRSFLWGLLLGALLVGIPAVVIDYQNRIPDLSEADWEELEKLHGTFNETLHGADHEQHVVEDAPPEGRKLLSSFSTEDLLPASSETVHPVKQERPEVASRKLMGSYKVADSAARSAAGAVDISQGGGEDADWVEIARLPGAQAARWLR